MIENNRTRWAVAVSISCMLVGAAILIVTGLVWLFFNAIHYLITIAFLVLITFIAFAVEYILRPERKSIKDRDRDRLK